MRDIHHVNATNQPQHPIRPLLAGLGHPRPATQIIVPQTTRAKRTLLNSLLDFPTGQVDYNTTTASEESQNYPMVKGPSWLLSTSFRENCDCPGLLLGRHDPMTRILRGYLKQHNNENEILIKEEAKKSIAATVLCMLIGWGLILNADDPRVYLVDTLVVST